MSDDTGSDVPGAERRNQAVVAGQVVAWLAVVSVVTLSALVVVQMDSERGIVLAWASLMTVVSVAGAMLSTTRARIVSGVVLTVFAFLSGFSIGGAYSPGALLMLWAATLPDEVDEAWADRTAALTLVPLGTLLVSVTGVATRGVVLLAPLLAAAIMWRARRLRALVWALLVFPTGYALFDVAYRFVLRGD